MHPLMRALAHSIDQSRYAAQQLKLDSVESLLVMASVDLAARMRLIELHQQAAIPERTNPAIDRNAS